MNDKDLAQYKKRLLEMRATLTHEVDHIEGAIRGIVSVPGELSHLPTHNADRDSEGVDEEVTVAQNEEGLLEAVEAALKRIEAKSYGRCQQCQAEVAPERLAALPFTAYCVTCEQAREQAATS
jgi:RNA polymerase-binding transcription factor DksA